MLNRKRNRLIDYDYSQSGYYFITICVHMMSWSLSEVANGKILLNKYGAAVENSIKFLKDRYVNIDVDEYVIMPNHVHAIIIIDRSGVRTTRELSKNISNQTSPTCPYNLRLNRYPG